MPSFTPPVLPADKGSHWAYVSLATAVVFCVAYASTKMLVLSIVVAGIFANVAIIGKELSDYLLNQRAIAAGQPPPHGVELLDIVAGEVGMAVVLLPLVLVLLLK